MIANPPRTPDLPCFRTAVGVLEKIENLKKRRSEGVTDQLKEGTLATSIVYAVLTGFQKTKEPKRREG